MDHLHFPLMQHPTHEVQHPHSALAPAARSLPWPKTWPPKLQRCPAALQVKREKPMQAAAAAAKAAGVVAQSSEQLAGEVAVEATEAVTKAAEVIATSPEVASLSKINDVATAAEILVQAGLSIREEASQWFNAGRKLALAGKALQLLQLPTTAASPATSSNQQQLPALPKQAASPQEAALPQKPCSQQPEQLALPQPALPQQGRKRTLSQPVPKWGPLHERRVTVMKSGPDAP